MCMLILQVSLTAPSELVKQLNAKNIKSPIRCVKTLFKKMQLGQMRTRRIVLKSPSAAVHGGTVENRAGGVE